MANYSFEVTLKANASAFASAMRQALGEVEGLENKTKNSTSNMNQGFFSVGTAIKGIFAIDAVRLFLDGLNMVKNAAMDIAGVVKGIVTNLVDVNAKWETMGLGMSATYASIGEVRDQYGKLVDDATTLAKTNAMGAETTKKLIMASFQAMGTPEEYANTFQNILGAISQSTKETSQSAIDDMTIKATQGLIAIAHLREGLFPSGTQKIGAEYAQLLQGNFRQINPLVRALNIDKDEFEKWKQLGTIQQELNNKMHFFLLQSKDAKYTFQGMSDTFKGLLQLFELGAGKGLFKVIEDGMHNALNFLLPMKDGVMTLNPIIQNISNVMSKIFSGSGQAARDLIDKIVLFAMTHGPLLIKIGLLINDIIVLMLKSIGDIFDWIDKFDQPLQEIISFTDILINNVRGFMGDLEGFLTRLLGPLIKIQYIVNNGIFAALTGGKVDVKKWMDDFDQAANPKSLKNMGDASSAASLADASRSGQFSGAQMKSLFDSVVQKSVDTANLHYSVNSGKYLSQQEADESAKDPWEKMMAKVKPSSVAEIMGKITEFQQKTGVLPKLEHTGMGYDKNKQIVEFKFTDPRGGGSKSFMAEMSPQDKANFTDFVKHIMEQNQRMNENYGNPVLNPQPVIRGF